MVDNNRERGSDSQPIPDEFDAAEIEAIVAFLGEAGGLGLLVELGEHPKRFMTLKETMGVSSATIRNRLSDGRELGLIDDPTYNSNGHKVHPLTPKGMVVYEEVLITDLPRIQHRIWELQNELEEGLDEFEQRLAKRPDELNEEFARKLTESL